MEKQKEAPKSILNVAKYLRSGSGLKNRQAILNGKRVDYFKGNRKNTLLSNTFFRN